MQGKLRRCARCGAEFTAHGEKRLCPVCRDEASHEPTLIEHTCKTCSASFTGGPRAMYCPACRAERSKEADKRHKAAQKVGAVRHLGSTGICELCGRPYTVTCGTQRYCPACGPAHSREVTLPRKRVLAAKFRAENPDYKASMKESGTVCVVCGKLFTATTPTNTCSPECRKKRKQERQKAADAKRRKKSE